MTIQRINSYQDARFSQAVLNQHGCFLVDGAPYEIEIISRHEAVIRGREAAVYPEIIEYFRFYTPHITVFYDDRGTLLQEYPPAHLITLSLSDIQPSQFYVDDEKISAVSSFLHKEEDIIIQVQKYGNRYISLDGHTRLYYAVMMGWKTVTAVEEPSSECIVDFVAEAIRRGIRTPYDLLPVSHEEYEVKWNQFCETYFAQKNSQGETI